MVEQVQAEEEIQMIKSMGKVFDNVQCVEVPRLKRQTQDRLKINREVHVQLDKHD